MHTRQNLAVSFVLAISMVGISYGVGGDMGAGTEPLTDGSAAYPYLIEDLTDFDVFADPCNSATYWTSGVYTKLTCDPNLTGRPYTTAVIAPDTPDTDWQFNGTPFDGIFDGNGHIVRNLTIDTAGAGNDYLGLFGRIESAGTQVKNLGLENINITGGIDSYYLGGLCGLNDDGAISNCYATGSVTGDDRLGGLCGFNSSGTITNCYATGSVTGGIDSDFLGGLCGHNSHGSITHCYATGSVNGEDNPYSLGGLCGWNRGTITNCYATGSVNGGDNSSLLGGLCGLNGGTITNCYAAGLVSGGAGSDYLGGLCGENEYGIITNCFWDVETSGIGTEGDNNYGATGKTTEQMQTQSTFADVGWVFVDYQTGLRGWYLPVSSYPLIYWQNPTAVAIPDVTNMTLSEAQTALTDVGLTLGNVFYINSWQIPEDVVTGLSVHIGGYVDTSYPVDIYISAGSSGDGSQANPYGIASQADLDAINNNPSMHYIVTADIYLGYHMAYTTAVIAPDTDNSDNGFQGTFFAGIFDGNGHIISNLTIDTAGAGNDYLGLFGKIDGSGAKVKNLGMENVNVTGGDYSDYLGGLCGLNDDGAISNCYAASSVTGGSYLGGLCGYNSSGTITNCFATGPVTGNSRLGGLCGENYIGKIINCYATGSVTGGDDSWYLGGLCGENYRGPISNCYAAGSVTGGADSDYLGGLCGLNDDGAITNCYAVGSVAGGTHSGSLGGLCGWSEGDITNCYAAGSVTGEYNSFSLGGLFGRNWGGTITNCYATGSVTGGYNSFSLGGLFGRNWGGTITNCYATGSVTGGADSYYLGGLCGANEGLITNCFWDVETSGMTDGVGNQDPDPAGVIGKTTAEMQTQSTFADAGWDFTNEIADGTSQIWQMPTGGGYPVLSIFDGYTPVLLNGDGTEANPYLINDAAQLGAMYHYNSNACFRLQSDVDLTGIQWSTAIVPAFGGCFDGNGYVIYNLNINGSGYLGLFGRIEGSSVEVKNLGIENINIIGEAYSLGGLCGHNEGDITNCYATGSVTGGAGSGQLGGLCGRNEGDITNCYTTGSVTGGDYSWRLGGLCGRNERGTITNCYAAGSVTGGDNSSNLGGLCGYNWGGTITNCFWDVETSGIGIEGDDNYGATGKTTEQMQTQSTFTDANWDFSVVPLWHMPFQAIGYPMLGWQKDIPGDFTGCYGVYMDDFAVLSNAWLSDDAPSANWNEHCDLNGNGVIDPGDLKTFAEHWLCD